MPTSRVQLHDFCQSASSVYVSHIFFIIHNCTNCTPADVVRLSLSIFNVVSSVFLYAGADPENCFGFGMGTFELESPKTTKRDAKGFEGEMYGHGVYPLPSRLGGLGESRKLPQRGLGQSSSR